MTIGAAVAEERLGFARRRHQRIGRDLERGHPVVARGVDVAALHRFPRREGDGVHQVVEAAPAVAEIGEHRLELVLAGDVDLVEAGAGHVGGQLLEDAPQALALVAEGDLGPGVAEPGGDRPAEAAVVGDAHDEGAFSGEIDLQHGGGILPLGRSGRPPRIEIRGYIRPSLRDEEASCRRDRLDCDGEARRRHRPLPHPRAPGAGLRGAPRRRRGRRRRARRGGGRQRQPASRTGRSSRRCRSAVSSRDATWATPGAPTSACGRPTRSSPW